MSTSRQHLNFGATLAVLVIVGGLYAGGAFDYLDMGDCRDPWAAAPGSDRPDVAASASPARNDVAGDPPRAELTSLAASASGKALFKPPSEDAIPTGEFGDVIRRAARSSTTRPAPFQRMSETACAALAATSTPAGWRTRRRSGPRS